MRALFVLNYVINNRSKSKDTKVSVQQNQSLMILVEIKHIPGFQDTEMIVVEKKPTFQISRKCSNSVSFGSLCLLWKVPMAIEP